MYGWMNGWINLWLARRTGEQIMIDGRVDG